MHRDFCLTQFNPPGVCICDKAMKPYYVTMRENASGKTVRFVMREIAWGDGSEFWWSEGNYSCDCNRELEWREANGLPRFREEEDIPEPHCTSDKYAVVKIELSDGTVVYAEE